MARQLIVFVQILLANLILGQIETPQSHIVMSESGYYFQPKAQMTEWLADMYVSTLEECTRRCNANYLCRTFDYNSEPNWCRLFEVESSPGQIINDQSLPSQVGQVQLLSDLYQAFNQSCDYCVTNRYLTCRSAICQCPWKTFWNGLFCEKQRYAGDSCTSDTQCRTDYEWACVQTKVCTSTGQFVSDNHRHN